MNEMSVQKERVVVGIDGSAGSVAALEWAMSFAAAREDVGVPVQVRAVHALTPPISFGVDSIGLVPTDRWDEFARRTLEATVAEVPAAADTCELVMAHGGAATVLLEDAAAHNAIIVVGTRGAGLVERVILGSVSRRLAANDRIPVAVVPESAVPFGEDTVVGFDSSPGAIAALRWANRFCPGEIRPVFNWAMPRSVNADHGMDLDKIEAAAKAALFDGVRQALGPIPARVIPLSRHGDPRTLLIQAGGASQTVVGSRSRTGLRGLWAGSVAIYVAAHSRVTTVIVPPNVCVPAAPG